VKTAVADMNIVERGIRLFELSNAACEPTADVVNEVTALLTVPTEEREPMGVIRIPAGRTLVNFSGAQVCQCLCQSRTRGLIPADYAVLVAWALSQPDVTEGYWLKDFRSFKLVGHGDQLMFVSRS